MNDEHFDRTYLAGRAELNAQLDRAFATIGRSVNSTFGALHRIQFAAPWTKRRTDVGCA
ncbi:MAG: hypothetical protein M3448_07560 [Pseudomonadota bacterium]|nr:hypothetical protein [Sphingomonas sp.]MDQ3483242.1 hypothetical protein [Pseudomonadota bacterium]